MLSPMFITFEGIEGCGKSTQAKMLYEELRKRKVPVILTSEPGGTRLGEIIRKTLLDPKNKAIVPLAEFFLYQADRVQHVYEVIKPALRKGSWVLCDRFTDSTVAYQGYARGISIDIIEKTNTWSTGGLKPNITFLLDCPVDMGLKRARERNRVCSKGQEARFENEEKTFHEAVRRGFLEIARQDETRFVVIDARQDKSSVFQSIFEHIERHLP